MAVPSENEFMEFSFILSGAGGHRFIKITFQDELDKYLKDDFILDIDKPTRLDKLLSDLTLQNVEHFLSEVHDLIEQQDKLRCEHPVQRWLCSQECFSLATQNLYSGTYKNMDRESFIRTAMEGICSILTFDPETKSISCETKLQIEELKYFVMLNLEYSGHRWLSDFIDYLYIYYHRPGFWSSMRAAHGASADDYPQLKQALRSSSELIDFINENYLDLGKKNKKALLDQLINFNRELEFSLKSKNIRFSPVKRIDQNAEVRELIYRLWLLYNKLNGNRGVASIYRLMCLEGIDSNYDERAIHRMIKHWEQEKSALPNEFKSLASEYPDIFFSDNFGEQI
jgi:hypothetical protein